MLDQHFARLSPLEREVMNWLAIEREPVDLATLLDELVHSPSRRVVLETLRSLHRRSLLERDGERLSLQNVVLEYTTDRLVEDFGFWMDRGAIENPKSAIINRFALVKAQAKEYVRASQRRMLLQPVADQLAARLGVAGAVHQLQRLLAHLRQAALRAPGYAAANLLHLLSHLGEDLRGYDFSHLSLRQADLRGVRLPQANLAGADLTGARFTETLGLVRGLAFSPNGEFLVVGTRGGEITTWRLADYQLCQVIQAHTQTVNHLAFYPKPVDTSSTGASEGELLASVADDQTAALWAFEPGEGRIHLLRRLRGHTEPVSRAAFHPDGKLLTTAGDDGAIRLWSVAGAGHGQPEQAVLHSERLWKIAFSPRPEGPRQTLAGASQQDGAVVGYGGVDRPWAAGWPQRCRDCLCLQPAPRGPPPDAGRGQPGRDGMSVGLGAA